MKSHKDVNSRGNYGTFLHSTLGFFSSILQQHCFVFDNTVFMLLWVPKAYQRQCCQQSYCLVQLQVREQVKNCNFWLSAIKCVHFFPLFSILSQFFSHFQTSFINTLRVFLMKMLTVNSDRMTSNLLECVNIIFFYMVFSYIIACLIHVQCIYTLIYIHWYTFRTMICDVVFSWQFTSEFLKFWN